MTPMQFSLFGVHWCLYPDGLVQIVGLAVVLFLVGLLVGVVFTRT